MRRNFQWKKPNFSIWQLHLSPLILMLYILCDPYNSLILVLMVFMILMVHWCLSFLVLVSDPYGLLILILMVLGILMVFFGWSLYSWSTDPFGPKGRQLEVGAQRAPRLLVFSFLLTLGVLGVLCGRCLSFVVDVRCGGCCTICCSFSFKLFLIFLPNWLSHNFLPCFHLVLELLSVFLTDCRTFSWFFLLFSSYFLIPFFNFSLIMLFLFF